MKYLAILALAALAALLPASARAESVGSDCHAFSAVTETYAQVAADPSRWTCGPTGWTPGSRPVAWLRFDARSFAAIGTPRSLVSRISSFRALSIARIDRAGRVSPELSFGLGDVRAVGAGPLFAVQVPPLEGGEQAIVVRIEQPADAQVLSEAALSSNADGEGWSARAMLAIAALCGMFIAPILFNLVFYTVLRERFVLWHSAMAAGMLGFTFFSSGLVLNFVRIEPQLYSWLNPFFFILPVAAAGMFAASYLEADVLTARMRFLVRLAAPWSLIAGGFFSLPIEALRPIANPAFNLIFIPVLGIYAATMWQAHRRGSRAVRFQIAAWVPIMVVCSERIGRGVGLWSAPSSLDQTIYLACALEVLITALGVADRFMTIKQQRDNARATIDLLEVEAVHDPLTGLNNRRGIEAQFEELRRAGFDTLAVIDLDHFKQVNDASGHAVGDQVLAATGQALRGDNDLFAWRLGGEEFLILLRGSNALERAESRRQAITSRVAALVPGLPAPVTASMGVVELPRGAMLATGYAELYARADALLYEAKRSGRNRTCSEKLTVFAGGDRRRRNERRRQARQDAA